MIAKTLKQLGFGRGAQAEAAGFVCVDRGRWSQRGGRPSLWVSRFEATLYHEAKAIEELQQKERDAQKQSQRDALQAKRLARFRHLVVSGGLALPDDDIGDEGGFTLKITKEQAERQAIMNIFDRIKCQCTAVHDTPMVLPNGAAYVIRRVLVYPVSSFWAASNDQGLATLRDLRKQFPAKPMEDLVRILIERTPIHASQKAVRKAKALVAAIVGMCALKGEEWFAEHFPVPLGAVLDYDATREKIASLKEYRRAVSEKKVPHL